MDDARAGLIEANISSFLIDMGAAGGGDTRSDSEITWTVGGSPLSYHNAVVRCDAPPARADALIDEWLAELRRRNVAGSWHVSPSTAPADLPERLVAHGFDDAGDEPAMLADLSAPPPVVGGDHELQIERVRNDAMLNGYRDVLASGFGEGPREADWVTSVFRTIGLADDSAWRHYVGQLDEAPVSTVSLLVRSGVGGIYFVCTVAEVRQRGFGAAITRHAMVEARDLRCSAVVLGASSMGYPIYRRLGFEEVFRYRLFEWPP
jgi:hypothetical protein